jgi:DNA-binding CsgD family transcriptional regulator
MTLWKQLQDSVNHANSYLVSTTLDDDLLGSVQDLSVREGHPPDEMILILLDQAVKDRREMDRARSGWESLSPREKQVAAYVCAGLTGRQIAAQLVLSPETIKTHMRHILRKFNLSSRLELRRRLNGWDLSPWLDRNGHI